MPKPKRPPEIDNGVTNIATTGPLSEPDPPAPTRRKRKATQWIILKKFVDQPTPGEQAEVSWEQCDPVPYPSKDAARAAIRRKGEPGTYKLADADEITAVEKKAIELT
jgi:hypothetical protein